MDIKKTVSELLSTGINQQELADLVPCSQAAINAFLNGKRGTRPSLAIGQRLLALHKERCKRVKSVASEPLAANLIPGAPIDGKKVREAKNGVREVITDTRKLRE